MYAGQRVQFHVYMKNTNNEIADTAYPFQDFMIGENNINWEYDDDSTSYNMIDESYRMENWRPDYVQGSIEEIYASASEEPILRFEQGYPHHTTRVTHSNFAGDDTWKVRVHPSIDGVDFSEGWTTGGQDLVISGWSLGSETSDVTVTVDGVACEIDFETSTWENIYCSTGAADAVSSTETQPGSYGAKVDQVDPADSVQSDGSASAGVTPSLTEL